MKRELTLETIARKPNVDRWLATALVAFAATGCVAATDTSGEPSVTNGEAHGNAVTSGVDAPDSSTTDAPDASTTDAPDASTTDAPDTSVTTTATAADAPSTVWSADAPDSGLFDAPDTSTWK